MTLAISESNAAPVAIAGIAERIDPDARAGGRIERRERPAGRLRRPAVIVSMLTRA